MRGKMTDEQRQAPAEFRRALAANRRLEMTDEQARVLASFPKRVGAEVRITAKRYRGYELVDLRVFYEDDQGGWLPTKQGICVRLDQFPLLVAHELDVLHKLGLELPTLDEE